MQAPGAARAAGVDVAVTHDLPLALKLRAAVERALLARVIASPWIVARLARRRPASLEGRALDPQIAAVLAIDDVQASSDLTHDTPPVARLRLAHEIRVVEAPPPPGVEAIDRYAPGPASSIPVRVYTPEGLGAPSPAVVFFHGGGWVTGSVATHDAFCRRLAVGARCRVASVDYRLAPEHRFPAAVDDALAGYLWVARRAGDLGVDPARIAVAGDSAGGNLAAVVARRARGDAHPPALQVLVYPGLDMTCSRASHASLGEGYFLTRAAIAWYRGHYMGGADLLHPDASPLFASDLAGVAPALVYGAGFDPLRDEAKDYADRLREAGVRAEHREHGSLVHGFALMTALDAPRRATDEIIADVGRALRA
jgi:acetyl esterase